MTAQPEQLTLEAPPAPEGPPDDGSFDWYMRYGPSQARSLSVDQDGRRADHHDDEEQPAKPA